MNENDFSIVVASEAHAGYAQQICDEMAESAKAGRFFHIGDSRQHG